MYWLPYSSNTSHHSSQTLCLPWISYAIQKLMLSSRCSKSSLKHSVRFCGIVFLKQNFIAYRSSKVSSLQIALLKFTSFQQSGFCRVYSNCCCSCSFKPEIIKLVRLYNIVNFQESTTILNTCQKMRIYIYIYMCGAWCNGYRRCGGRGVMTYRRRKWTEAEFKSYWLHFT